MPGFLSTNDLKTTDASNTTFNSIATDVNVMKPSDARKWVQAFSGAEARWLADLGATSAPAGTATAITVTLNQAYTAYGTSAGQIPNGAMIALKMPSAATGASTLNINSIGTKAIRREGDTAIAANDWLANATVLLRYDTAYNSAAGAWVLLNPSPANVTGAWTVSASSVSLGSTTALTLSTDASTLTLGAYTLQGVSTFGGFSVAKLYASGTVVASVGIDITGNVSSGGQAVGAGGIKFPSTQNPLSDANTLDDYKEFTWTLTAAYATVGSSTWAYGTRTCQGTKVGSSVVISMDLSITPTIGTGSGNLTFSGFPYLGVVNSPLGAGSLNSSWTWPASRTQVLGQVGSDGSIIIKGEGSAATNTQFAASNMTTGAAHAIRFAGGFPVQ
jgi:hypothetical protein